jgi:integrase/recombinase XerD
VEYLRTEKLWGNDDPLFPSTLVSQDSSRRFEASGLRREHWASAAPIRVIFREAFAAAGLPYFNPHSLRSTLVRLGEATCRTPEEFKAFSQNLGHEGVRTTFMSYGDVPTSRQGEILRFVGRRRETPSPEVMEIAQAVAEALKGR